MKLISCHDGKLHTLNAPDGAGESAGPSLDVAFRTGLPAVDALPPGGAFARGAVHELITAPADGPPLFVAAWLARCGGAGSGDKERGRQGDKRTWGGGDHGATELGSSLSLSPCPLASLSPCLPAPPPSRAVVWSDPNFELYPPAVAAMGIPLGRLFLLHPTDEAEQLWALAECLRCRGVGVVIAALPERRKRLTRVEARRLQLAAEHGGGVGLLLRKATSRGGGGGGRNAPPPPEHAAVTRWRVGPAPGEHNVQRWRLQLIFGHGGQVGQSVILEHHRDASQQQPLLPRLEAHPVRPAAELADRPAVPAPSRATG